MSENQPQFILPEKMEVILASLVFYYQSHNEPLMQSLIVNSAYSFDLGCDENNWNGQWGHEIRFSVPAKIYIQIIDFLSRIESELRERINDLFKASDEYIIRVTIELQSNEEMQNWREQSGLLVGHKPSSAMITKYDSPKFWEQGYFRLFLSHKSEYKVETAKLKHVLRTYGISAFVAHDDIEPTKEWLIEIEKALHSMEAFVALLTDKFSESNWTDQEVGFAVGRCIPVIPVRLGRDPYGFIGKYQAIPGINKNTSELAQSIFETLFFHSDTRERLCEGVMSALEQASIFIDANRLFRLLTRLDQATPSFITRLEKAWEEKHFWQTGHILKDGVPALIKRLRAK